MDATQNLGRASMDKAQPKAQIGKAVPVLLFLMIFSLVIDNSFKIISPALVSYFNTSASAVSWQVTLAGLMIGMAAVIYASLSDQISIRNLLVVGIGLITFGSVMGFLVHNNLWLVIVARIIQAAGLGATETLYLIFVARYVEVEKQKKYMGFSTAAFQVATVIGNLTGGFIATKMAWQNLFLVPLLTILVIPFILKFLPKDNGKKSHVDVIGMILIAVVSVTVMVFLTNFNFLVLAGFIVSLVMFLLYIAKKKDAFISIDFFKNKLFIYSMLLVLIIFSIEAAYMLNGFNFFMTDVYQLSLDKISMMFIPACLAAATVGTLSGAIAKRLNSFAAITLALVMITGTVFVSMFVMGASVPVQIAMLIIHSCSFALVYAPLLHTAIATIPDNNKGTAIGFFNLLINIAMSVGFTYSSKLIDGVNLGGLFGQGQAAHFSQVLLIIGFIGLVGILVFLVFVKGQIPKETAK